MQQRRDVDTLQATRQRRKRTTVSGWSERIATATDDSDDDDYDNDDDVN